jgi:hypothetical protein
VLRQDGEDLLNRGQIRACTPAWLKTELIFLSPPTVPELATPAVNFVLLERCW